jgi:hypothetical protein
MSDPASPLSYARDIRDLFRPNDIIAMRRARGFDLSAHEDVSQRAESILARLIAGDMPCDQAWPAERIETFRQWIADGKLP